MRLEQLDYLASVARHGSLRRAAEQLHVSQPALSEALAKLEHELGVTLLDRQRTGARVTVRGRDLLQHVEEVLDAADRLRAAAGDTEQVGRGIRLGTVNAATAALVVPAVGAFHDDWPGIGVEVLDQRHDDVLRGVTEGGLDLGLVNLLESDDRPPGLQTTSLLRGRPVVVLPAGHPLVDLPVVGPDDVREHAVVLMRAGYAMHRFAHRLFSGRPPRTTVSADGATMGTAMVAAGLGVTFLPDYSVLGDPLERAGALVVRPLTLDVQVSLVLVRRRRRRTPLAERALVDRLVHQAASWTNLQADKEKPA